MAGKVKRRVFTILAVLSLLLFLASMGMWARSYWWWDSLTLSLSRHNVILGSASSELVTIVMRYEREGSKFDWDARSERADDAYEGELEHLLRIRSHRQAGSFLGTKYDSWQFNLPYVYAWAVTLAIPTAWLLRHVRRNGRRAGRCPSCGYDLRATPGRCPECGHVSTGAAVPRTVTAEARPPATPPAP